MGKRVRQAGRSGVASRPVIALDPAVVIYYPEGVAPYAERVERFLEATPGQFQLWSVVPWQRSWPDRGAVGARIWRGSWRHD